MGKGKKKWPKKDERYTPGEEIPDDVHQWFSKYWCGCGESSQGLDYLREVLGIYEHREMESVYKPYDVYVVSLEKLKEFEAKYGTGAAMFALYLFGGTGLTEHGGSVYGAWMTTLGMNLKDFVEANPDYET